MKTLPYNMDEYQADGLATEAPITPELTERLLKHWQPVQDALEEVKFIGAELDKVKRVVYYGKVNAELIVDEITIPSGGKAKRIQQEQMVRILHGAIGLCTEIGETGEMLVAHIHNDLPLDKVNLEEEMGDLLWYINIILHAIGSSIPQCALKNRNKLEVRHPQKFTQESALNRNLEQERKVLEQ